MDYKIRKANISDASQINKYVKKYWKTNIIISKGKIHDIKSLPGLIPENNGEICGLLIYNIVGNECEIVSLNSELHGAGTALLKAIINHARRSNCSRLWVVTTNDNTKALRFYQKNGFSIIGIHINAIEKSRELKPEIPAIGMDNIPIKDEIELEMSLI